MNDALQRTIQGKVELYNGSTLLGTFLATDKLQEIAVSRTGEKGKFFGFGICQQATVKVVDREKELNFLKGEILKTSFRANSTGTYTGVCPPFYIKDVQHDEKTNVFTITAYDALDSATAHTWSELDMIAPYTIKDVVTRISSVLGLSGVTSIGSEFDLAYTDGANFGGEENLRTVLNAIAEATQTIYFLNASGAIKFVRLSQTANPVLSIPKKDYFELATGLPTTISKIVHVTELGDNVFAGDDTGVTQYVRDNPFWNTRTDLSTLLPAAIDRIGGLTIVPYNIQWRGNFLTEIGDKISLETKTGGLVNTFILEDSFTYNGGLSQTCSWEFNPDSDKTTAANPVTIGERLNQTFAKVDKIEKNITLYVSEVIAEELPTMVEDAIDEVTDGLVDDINGLKATTNTHTENISSLTLTTQSINSEVSSIKESTTTITNELDEVVATQTEIQEDIGSLRVTSTQITASVSSVEQKITNVADQLENHTDTTTERIDSIAKDVSLKLDKKGVEIAIESTLSEGVEKVVTASKKYTFDDTGLNISSGDSDISTKVTEDGMRIYRHSSEVLTVDNQGVQAADLHARTFLIIGENSRLEDRGNRTACFWIGPAGG
jgi:hypothetical protein